jgi:hypothetical protein
MAANSVAPAPIQAAKDALERLLPWLPGEVSSPGAPAVPLMIAEADHRDVILRLGPPILTFARSFVP